MYCDTISTVYFRLGLSRMPPTLHMSHNTRLRRLSMPKKKYMYFLQQQTLCHIWLCIGKEREYGIAGRGEEYREHWGKNKWSFRLQLHLLISLLSANRAQNKQKQTTGRISSCPKNKAGRGGHGGQGGVWNLGTYWER